MKDKYCSCALAFGHGRLKAALVWVSQILLFPFQFLYVFGAWRLRNLPIPLGLLRADLQLPFFSLPLLEPYRCGLKRKQIIIVAYTNSIEKIILYSMSFCFDKWTPDYKWYVTD